jgi:hypothetical protein
MGEGSGGPARRKTRKRAGVGPGVNPNRSAVGILRLLWFGLWSAMRRIAFRYRFTTRPSASSAMHRRTSARRVRCGSLLLAGFQRFLLLRSNQAFSLLARVLMKLPNFFAFLLRRKRRVITNRLYFFPGALLDLPALFHGRFRNSGLLPAWLLARRHPYPAALGIRDLRYCRSSQEQN